MYVRPGRRRMYSSPRAWRQERGRSGCPRQVPKARLSEERMPATGRERQLAHLESCGSTLSSSRPTQRRRARPLLTNVDSAQRCRPAACWVDLPVGQKAATGLFGSACDDHALRLTAGKLTSELSGQTADVDGRQCPARKSHPQEPEAVLRQYPDVRKAQHFIRSPRRRAAACFAGS